MSSYAITIKPQERKKVLVEVDINKFERLAANLGFFSNSFLSSLDRAEKDFEAGRIKKIKSLKDLRKR